MWKRIFTVRTFRIHYRICRRQEILLLAPPLFKGHLVVIRYDHSHPHIFSKGNLLSRRNPIVTGEHRVHAVIICPLDQVNIQPISVRHTIRNIIVRICPQPL